VDSKLGLADKILEPMNRQKAGKVIDDKDSEDDKGEKDNVRERPAVFEIFNHLREKINREHGEKGRDKTDKNPKEKA